MSLPGLVWVAAIAAAFFYMSNPLSMIPSFGDSLHRAILVALSATALTLPWGRLPRIPWSVLLVIGLMYASLAWTISWDVTWGVSMVYVKVALVAWLCTWSTDLRTVAHGLHLGGVVVVVASIYAYWAGLPFADVPLETEGYLAGVGTNRNILSYTVVLALAFALATVPATVVGRVVWASGILVLGLGLFLSQSGTGFVAAAILVVVSVALSLGARVPPHQLRRVRVGAAVVGTLLVAGGAFALPLVGVLLGRDVSTLSGRTEIWAAIWHACSGQRLLGQGWGTTWPHAWVQAPPNPRYDAISAELGAAFSHGHNSLLDVLPDLGVVGAAGFGLLHVLLLVLALRQWRGRRSGLDRLRVVLLSLVALVLFGITEPVATTPLGWFLLVILTTITLRERAPEGGQSGEGAARYRGKNAVSGEPAARQAAS